MTLYQELLTELIPLVSKKLLQCIGRDGDFDEYDVASRAAYRLRAQAATEELKEFFAERYDARFTQHADVCTVHLAGLRSSSTMGWRAALRNWQRSAETKLASALVHRDGFNPHGSGPVPVEPRES